MRLEAINLDNYEARARQVLPHNVPEGVDDESLARVVDGPWAVVLDLADTTPAVSLGSRPRRKRSVPHASAVGRHPRGLY